MQLSKNVRDEIIDILEFTIFINVQLCEFPICTKTK